MVAIASARFAPDSNGFEVYTLYADDAHHSASVDSTTGAT